LRVVERALEANALDVITPEVRCTVEGYNLDDCKSALQLRVWLEQLRGSVEAAGTEVPRPALVNSEVSETITERGRRVEGLVTALTAGLQLARSERNEEEQARWLFAHLLDFHRREAKAPWWEFFRLRDLTEEEYAKQNSVAPGASAFDGEVRRFKEFFDGAKLEPRRAHRRPRRDRRGSAAWPRRRPEDAMVKRSGSDNA
jgi:hypothetical protein